QGRAGKPHRGDDWPACRLRRRNADAARLCPTAELRLLTMSDAAQPFEISVTELAGRRGAAAVLDVREPWELEICRLNGSIDIPLASLVERIGELPREAPLVVMCHHGGRSARAVQFLRSRGFANAVNLSGGIDAWARQIDPAMRTY